MTSAQLRRLNNDLARQLTPENRKMMTDMVVYLRVSRLSDDQVEVIRQDLLDMALSAQSRHEPLSAVFGEDGQAFCDEIIANVKPEGWAKILKAVPGMLGACGFFAILNLIASGFIGEAVRALHHQARMAQSYPISLGFVVNTLVVMVVALGIVQFIGRFAFRTQDFLKKFRGMPKVQRFAVGALVGLAAFGYLAGTRGWSHIILVHINLWVYLAIAIPLCAYFVLLLKPEGQKGGPRGRTPA
ncbi:MAG: hypothetical protein M0Z36_09235 [Thermaerobacter sp.]|nr:hypothetical protein [Thermaerobacter sp.]